MLPRDLNPNDEERQNLLEPDQIELDRQQEEVDAANRIYIVESRAD